MINSSNGNTLTNISQCITVCCKYQMLLQQMHTLHHNTYLQKQLLSIFSKLGHSQHVNLLAIKTCKCHCHSLSVCHVHYQVMPHYWMKKERQSKCTLCHNKRRLFTHTYWRYQEGLKYLCHMEELETDCFLLYHKSENIK